LTGEDPGDHLLTLQQVADRLKVSTRTIRDHVKEGRLRAIDVGAGRVNQLLRFTSADISDFVTKRQAVPCPSIKGPAPKPIRMTSKSKVLDFREALDARLAETLKNSSAQKSKKPGHAGSGKPPTPPRP
jgi:excisionase family DNA binding protein